MPISLKAAQGGSKAIFKERPIWSSGTFIVPVSAVYLVTAIGPGGSGAWAPAAGNGKAATGGAAGGLAQKKVRLNKGDQLTIVIGAGGQPPATAGQNGGDGGNTTVSGPGLALIARGGKGGKTKAAGLGTVEGAVGGLAEGGDENLPGGPSGSATITAAVAAAVAITGGGAVAVKGVGYKSGDASSGAQVAATGGAGVGGQSGDAISTSGTTYTPGGSAVRASPPAMNSTSSPTGNTAPERAFSADGTAGPAYQRRMLEPNGGGVGGSSQGVNGVCWAGVGSAVMQGSSQLAAGLFAGAGARNAGSTNGLYRSFAGIGAGSGAAVDDKPDAGGDGFVMIEWFEDLE